MRRSLSFQIRQNRFNVLLTTYEYVMKDRAQLAKVGIEFQATPFHSHHVVWHVDETVLYLISVRALPSAEWE